MLDAGISAPNARLSPSVIDSAETRDDYSWTKGVVFSGVTYCQIFRMKIPYCAFYQLMDRTKNPKERFYVKNLNIFKDFIRFSTGIEKFYYFSIIRLI